MQQRTQPLPRSVLFFVTFACLGISIWFLNAYASLFNSFFLAAMIVMTASPIGFWLQNHGAPRWLALLLSMAAALIATLLIAAVLALSAVRMLEIIPIYVNNLAELQEQAGSVLANVGLTGEDIRRLVPPEAVSRTATGLIRMTLDSVSMFGLVILIVVFMIIESFVVPLKFRSDADLTALPPKIAFGFTQNIRQYVGITSLLGVVGGAVLAVVLYLLDIPFPALWGILYFVLNFVPMVGFWIAVIPPLLLAGQAGGLAAAVLVLVAYMLVSTIINQAIKPAVMRGGLDLSPFWSIMSLIVWSAILGPIGLIVGVPLTIALKELVFEPDAQARWFADLLGSGIALQEVQSPPAEEISEESSADQAE